MSDHTKGPWNISPDKTRTRGIDIIAAGRRKIVASVYWPFGDWNKEAQEHASANARLIAAAPELLEALQSQMAAHFATWMAARADYEGSTLSASLFEKEPEVIAARAVIAKATGGDQ